MPEKKGDLLRRFAKGNAVDLAQLKRMEDQLAELGRAGFMTDTGYAIRQPLGYPRNPEKPDALLANARYEKGRLNPRE